MTYEEFTAKIIAELAQILGEGISISRQEMRKNNGVLRDAMTVRTRGSNLSPVFYLDSLYGQLQDGTSYEDIFEKIREVCCDTQKNRQAGLEDFVSWEKARRRVVPRLVSASRNTALLAEVPHRKVLNLALIYYYLPESRAWEESSVLVRREHLDIWQIDEQMLFQEAELNKYHLMPPVFMSIGEMIRQLTDTYACSEADESFYVLSSRDKCWGAVWMCDDQLLGRIRCVLGCDFYILPSSVHEVMILPWNEKIRAENLCGIVREINEQQVADEEVLEDAVYLYEADKGVSAVVTES